MKILEKKENTQINELKRKTIVIVVNTSWNVYNFRLGLIRSLQNMGNKIVIIAPYDKYSDILSKEFEYYNIKMNNKGTNPKEDLKTLFNLYKLYKKVNPDIILHYTIKPNIYGTIAANLLGIKIINNIAGLGTLFVNQDIITKIAKCLYKFSQSKADKIFFQNRDDFDMFINKGLIQKKKCSILPGSGVDTQKFKPVSYKKQDNKFKFLFVARILWDKGIKEYVEASEKLKEKYPDIKFQILGFLDSKNKSAVSVSQMNEWVKRGSVEYLGVSDNVQEEISKADCIVLPSFYREGTPRVLLESASMAKPIITTDNVGCRDVVDDNINGYLCKVRDPEDLMLKMEKMINISSNKRLSMGKAGRVKILNEFDEKIVINKYIKALKDL